MADKENLDSMAQRYKEEMLRLYRRSGVNESVPDRTPPPAKSPEISPKPTAEELPPPPRVPEPEKTTSVLHCNTDGCRFLSPEEIMRKESGEGLKPEKKPYCDIAVTDNGTDITASLINGAGFAGENLVTSGTAGLDVPDSGKTGGKTAYGFAGIYLAPVCDAADSADDNSDNTSRRISSGIYSDEIPDYLRLPADSSEETVIPRIPDSSYIVPDRWNSLTGDTGWGYIQFDVCGGDKNEPLKGAAIIITRNAGDRVLLSRIMTSGSSGRTPTAVLPAPERTSAVRCVPYAEYTALVYADGYRIARNVTVKVSAGIKTIQPVYLPKQAEV